MPLQTGYLRDPEAVDPVGVPPTLVACAKRVTVAAGDIAAIEGPFNIAAGLYLDVGSFMLLFFNPQPDAASFVEVLGQGAAMSATEVGEDYCIVQAVDAGGNPADPSAFSVNVWRF